MRLSPSLPLSLPTQAQVHPLRTLKASSQRQGVLKLFQPIEYTALGYYADSVHTQEASIADGLRTLMGQIKARLSEHSTAPYQIKDHLDPYDETDPDAFFSSSTHFQKFYDDLLPEETASDNSSLENEFAQYAEAFEEEAAPSKGIRIDASNGCFDDEKVAVWLHPRMDDTPPVPPALDIHTDILDNKDNPDSETEKQVVSQVLQHFLEKELLSAEDINKMIAYESDQKLHEGDVWRATVKNGIVGFNPETLNYVV